MSEYSVAELAGRSPAAEPIGPFITCPDCGYASYHPMDIAEGYCGNCNWWTGDPALSDYRHRD